MEKKKPMRKCVGCGESKEKAMLIRVIRDTEGEIHLDPSGRANGRGAYVCKDSKCLEKAIKKRGLERSLKVVIPEETLEQLKKELEING
ncbi:MULTISPECIES: RNase P modulator RnpM [unclassified Butyrivibrio]|uniref:RNase P modulator RnpM n=1 Tax=unclassified Butyrivibrio TaxID=2639466 RepID=UPI00040C2788|nr:MULTISPECIES: YlxR family protein [unclassified Butyrivibrio]